MSTEISTSQDFVRERTEKTRAAQATLATDASWTWPLKTLAQWDADLASLDATANGSLAKVTNALEADMLAARGLLDARFDDIHKFTLLAVGVMRVRAATLPGLLQIVNDLGARGDSRRATEDEADDLLAAWEEWESQTGAAFSPAPGKTLAEFKLLLEGASGAGQATNPQLATLKKNYKAALAKWRRSAGVLNVLFARLEDECIAWYAEATKVFPAGTAEGDMIRSQVPTDYTPEAPKPAPTPAPGATPAAPKP
jgi:hypothetical protein